jgi:hypothetical protein
MPARMAGAHLGALRAHGLRLVTRRRGAAQRSNAVIRARPVPRPRCSLGTRTSSAQATGPLA